MEKKRTYGADETYPNQREDFRIDDKLPFNYYPLGESTRGVEHTSVHDMTPILRNLKESNMNPEMILLIKLFDDKLNHIIKLISGDDTAGHQPVEDHLPTDLNISAGGICFRSNDSFKMGEVLNLVIGLPPQPYTHINILGEVLRVTKLDKGSGEGLKFRIALKFVHMEDGERQDITKYLFDVQRRRVRSKRK